MEGGAASKRDGAGGSITVSVKAGAQTLPISLPGTASVKDLMLQIKELTNVLPRGQKLIYKGKVLDSEMTLASAKVGNGAKLMLMASEGVHQGGKLKNVLGALHVPKIGKSIEKGRVGAWQATGIVSLRDAHLQTVPKEVWALGPAARIMDLSGNSLHVIPDQISALMNLQRLRLTSNSLTENNIHWTSLSSLQSLTNLALDHNRLKSIPAEIGNLKSLKLLSLSHNQIQTLPEEIGNLSQLEKFDINHNKLTVVPATFGQCTQLSDVSHLLERQYSLTQKEQVLSHALLQLQFIAPAVQAQQSHAAESAKGRNPMVNFSANHLTAIPSSFSKLVALKVLLLDNNALERIPGPILSECLELNTLSLHGNQITIVKLRETEGWTEFDKRRKSKYSKQLDFNVIGSSSGFDEGADSQQWTNW